jgi:hypothetical protein
LLDLMAQTPGFTVVSHVRDALGRVGLGIEWTYRGRTNAVIFDRRSYAYLGAVLAPPNVPNQGTLPGRPLPAGAALVKSGVVSKLPPVAATALRMGLKAVSKAGGSPGAAGKS